MTTGTTALKNPGWAALGAAGLGATFAISLSQAALAEGGLALILVVAASTALLGVPVSMAAARSPVDRSHPAGGVVSGMTEVWTTLAVAAALAPVVAQLGLIGLLLAGAAWSVAAFVRGARGSVAAALVLAALAIGVAMVIVSGVQGIGLSLMEPRWFPWTSWVGLGLIGGLVTASAGLGVVGAPERRGRRSAVAAGVGLLILVACVLRVAAPFEAGVLDGSFDLGLQAIALLIGPAAVLASRGREGRAGSAPIIGLVATVLFAGPAASALPFWWTSLLPIGLAILFVLRAIFGQAQRLDRFILGGGAAAALMVPVLAGSTLPEPLAAALLGLAPVAVVWVAGTRALLIQKAA